MSNFVASGLIAHLGVERHSGLHVAVLCEGDTLWYVHDRAVPQHINAIPDHVKARVCMVWASRVEPHQVQD